MEYTHFVSVAAIVYNDEGEILLIKSPRRGWEYPGGMVEPGETLQQALRREIYEETGAEIEIKGLIGICKNIEKDVVNIDFACSFLGGALRTSPESLEVQWVKPEEAVKLVTFPLTQKRLKHMLAGDGRIHCFGFVREPFTIQEDDFYPASAALF